MRISTLIRALVYRYCEYNEEELEFWVNTRTQGTLTREDLQRLAVTQSHEGAGSMDDIPSMAFDGGAAIPGLGEMGDAAHRLELEGDCHSRQLAKIQCTLMQNICKTFQFSVHNTHDVMVFPQLILGKGQSGYVLEECLEEQKYLVFYC